MAWMLQGLEPKFWGLGIQIATVFSSLQKHVVWIFNLIVILFFLLHEKHMDSVLTLKIQKIGES